MPAGIASWGTYLPAAVARRGPQPDAPERTAAAWDEDAFTMAVEAGRACLARRLADAGAVDALVLACLREPGEASAASLVTALGLPPSVRVIELPASVDAPADALDLALDRVEAGQARSALVLGASFHLEEDADVGDGAAALLVAPEGVVRPVARASVSIDHLWAGGSSPRLVPGRYELDRIVAPAAVAAVEAVVEAAGGEAAPAAWALSTAAGPALARRLGLAASPLAGDQPFSHATGADLLLRLAALCAGARAGERLLALDVGERAWASIWQASADPAPAPVEDRPTRRLGYADQVRSLRRRALPAPREIDAMDYVRQAGTVLRLEGSRCSSCGRVSAQTRLTAGTTALPPCCGPVEPVALGRSGTVRAFTRSQLTEHERLDPVASVVCDLDGGGRLVLEVAADAGGEVEVGTRVSLVLRRAFVERGRTIYLWKAVPEHG